MCIVHFVPPPSLTAFSPDDRWRFLARIQWSTRIPASNLSRTVAYWVASVAPAYCINVDFPIPVAYWLSVESADRRKLCKLFQVSHWMPIHTGKLLTRLLRHITGQNEHPNVQQQQMQPHKSHFILEWVIHKHKNKWWLVSSEFCLFDEIQPECWNVYFNGSDFFSILLMRPMVALNSSGATRDWSPPGKLVLKLLLKPNLWINKM